MFLFACGALLTWFFSPGFPLSTSEMARRTTFIFLRPTGKRIWFIKTWIRSLAWLKKDNWFFSLYFISDPASFTVRSSSGVIPRPRTGFPTWENNFSPATKWPLGSWLDRGFIFSMRITFFPPVTTSASKHPKDQTSQDCRGLGGGGPRLSTSAGSDGDDCGGLKVEAKIQKDVATNLVWQLDVNDLVCRTCWVGVGSWVSHFVALPDPSPCDEDSGIVCL